MSNKVKKRYRSWQGARGAQGNLNCMWGWWNLGTHRGVNTGCFAIRRKVRTFLLDDIFAHEFKKIQELYWSAGIMLLADGLVKKDTNRFYLPTAIIPTTKRSSTQHGKDATMEIIMPPSKHISRYHSPSSSLSIVYCWAVRPWRLRRPHHTGGGDAGMKVVY